jgi:chromosome segregation protein
MGAERRQLIERELAGIDKALPDLESAVKEATLAVHEAEQRVSDGTTRLNDYEQGLSRLRQADEKEAQELRKLLSEKATLDGRRRGIEATIDAHEGLTQGSKAVLDAVERKMMSGPYLPVGQAIQASKEYALAIETALGASANDLIVEDQRDAKLAIEWLKKNRAGRATFQPIPLMRPVDPSYEMRRILGEKGVVGRASELVSCASRHRPVVDSLLGRVIVVEELDDALRLAKTSGWSRMVTLDGEVVHGSGAVTGGQHGRQSYGLVQRKADLKDLQHQIQALNQVVTQLEAASVERSKERTAVERQRNEARAGLDRLKVEAAEAKEFLRALVDEQKSALRSREKLLTEAKTLEEGRPQADEPVDIEAIERQRDDLLRIYAAKSADSAQAEERLHEARSRVQQATARLEASRKRLRSAEEAETHRTQRLQNLGPERERLRQAIESHKTQREAAAIRRAEADRRLEELQSQRRERLEESLRLSEEAKGARETAATISETIHHSEVLRAKAEAKRANALARLMEDYGLSEQEAIEMEGQHEVPKDALTVVNRLRREIRAMGDVNLGAIEAFDRLTHRIDELSAQKDDISAGMDQVEASIRELDQLTRDRFLATFDAVQKAFAGQFTRLFGGGEGSISLTDASNVLESGIQLEVTLPGKRRQALNLLSGGERSLCASAFLFSLLSVKPSPLVVLDEVDAPLDGRNVERFADALFQFTDNTQFIVITHNESTIRVANVHLGVTMQPHDPGVSLLVPVKLPEDKALAA